MNEGKDHEKILVECYFLFNKNAFFNEFYNHVSKNELGFGEGSFYILWEKLISKFKNKFSFLEIGVYKGQTLCLIGYLSQKYNLQSKIYGVTPLKNIGDNTTQYKNSNYAKDICELHKKFNIPFDLGAQIIKGLSTDENVKKNLINKCKFDIIYIDGGHDYQTVVSDINLAKIICEKNGYIVMDDSCYFKNFNIDYFFDLWYKRFSEPLEEAFHPFFKGHKEVSKAVEHFLENDINYCEEYRVGHIRVFKKI